MVYLVNLLLNKIKNWYLDQEVLFNIQYPIFIFQFSIQLYPISNTVKYIFQFSISNIQYLIFNIHFIFQFSISNIQYLIFNIHFILLRMIPILEEKGIPHRTQTAYQAGVSCCDATKAVQETIKSYIDSGSTIFQCF